MIATGEQRVRRVWARVPWVAALAALLLLAWTGAGSPPPAAALQAPCHARFGSDPLDVAVISKRRDVSCKAARRIVVRFMHAGGGDGVPRTIRGWRCRWYPPGVSPGSSCHKRRRLIEFGTD